MGSSKLFCMVWPSNLIPTLSAQLKHGVHKQGRYNHTLKGLVAGPQGRDTDKLECVQRRAQNRGKFLGIE